MESENTKHSNSLRYETSPYLLQHAHNPVDWRAWNDSTLHLAKTLDKPLLISIGYSACHWCHVMEHESFANEAVAEVMNAHFVCVKVDREERPDVDQLYMNAAQLITGGGGWPLNCFAFPDGRPFYAGTYFKQDDWVQLLQTVNREWTQNRDKLEDYAQKLLSGIKQSSYLSKVDGFVGTKNNMKDLLDQSVAKWSESFDHEHGGGNRAPKFPIPNNYLFLQKYSYLTENSALKQHVHFTLEKILRGGIYDQIGGGICRYAVDNKWKIPHFEKMLYDNAQFLELYASAFQESQSEEYLYVINQVFNFLQAELLDKKSQLFYSALDADSEGVEGKYYTWSMDEVSNIVGDEIDLVSAYFGLNARGYWEEDRFILCRDDAHNLAQELSLSHETLTTKMRAWGNKLLEVREKRIRPGLDDKCLTSWNAMTVSGLCKAYYATQNEAIKTQAINTLNSLLDNQLTDENQLFHSYKNGMSTIPGFLEDYASMIQALHDVFQLTHDSQFAQIANRLMKHCLEYFYSEELGMFYFSSITEKSLPAQQMDYFDNVIPSSNSMMCRNLLHLSYIFNEVKYRSIALDMLDKIGPRIVQYGSGFSNWMLAITEVYHHQTELVIVGENAFVEAEYFQKKFLPNTIVYASKTGEELPIFETRLIPKETTFYVCTGTTCLEPTTDRDKVLELLNS